jgi:hypothetical protein
MRCLRALRALDLPQGYIGAGFVRNALWDELHERTIPTPLNDIDVIYFSGGVNPPQRVAGADNALKLAPQPQAYSPSSVAAKLGLKAQEQAIERELARMVPQANWQVKNQARMHVAHEHAPYQNCHDAISYWIERETCVAVRLLANDDLDILAPFGLEANFAGTISINPKYPRPEVFKQRLASKNWLTVWPLLTLVSP